MAHNGFMTHNKVVSIKNMLDAGTPKEVIAKHAGCSLSSVSRIDVGFRKGEVPRNRNLTRIIRDIQREENAKTPTPAEAQKQDTHGLTSAAAYVETSVINAINEIEHLEETVIAAVKQIEGVKQLLTTAKNRL